MQETLLENEIRKMQLEVLQAKRKELFEIEKAISQCKERQREINQALSLPLDYFKKGKSQKIANLTSNFENSRLDESIDKLKSKKNAIQNQLSELIKRKDRIQENIYDLILITKTPLQGQPLNGDEEPSKTR